MASSVVTVAGCHARDGYRDGTGEDARLSSPTGVAVSPDGMRVWIADTGNHCIRLFDAKTEAVTTYAGSTSGDNGHCDGALSDALFHAPAGMSFHAPTGALYVAEKNNHTVRCIHTALRGAAAGSERVTTVVGEAGHATYRNGLNEPNAVSVDAAGALWIADTHNHDVRYVKAPSASAPAGASDASDASSSGAALHSLEIKTWLVQAIAAEHKALGSKKKGQQTAKREAFTGDKHFVGASAGADLDQHLPGAVLHDPAHGKVYVSAGHRLLRIVARTAFVDLQIGRGTAGCEDGDAAKALFDTPRGMCLGADGAVYVCDTGNHLIRRVDPVSGAVRTVAGATNKASAFFLPAAVACDASNTLWVVDQHRLHRITLGADDKFVPSKPAAPAAPAAPVVAVPPAAAVPAPATEPAAAEAKANAAPPTAVSKKQRKAAAATAAAAAAAGAAAASAPAPAAAASNAKPPMYAAAATAGGSAGGKSPGAAVPPAAAVVVLVLAVLVAVWLFLTSRSSGGAAA